MRKIFGAGSQARPWDPPRGSIYLTPQKVFFGWKTVGGFLSHEGGGGSEEVWHLSQKSVFFIEGFPYWPDLMCPEKAMTVSTANLHFVWFSIWIVTETVKSLANCSDMIPRDVPAILAPAPIIPAVIVPPALLTRLCCSAGSFSL